MVNFGLEALVSIQFTKSSTRKVVYQEPWDTTTMLACDSPGTFKGTVALRVHWKEVQVFLIRIQAVSCLWAQPSRAENMSAKKLTTRKEMTTT